MAMSPRTLFGGLLIGICSTLNPSAALACSDEPYIGSMCLFAGNFEIRGWAKAEGQLLSISNNTALFSIIGTTYGGDGRTTFALPDLRGRTPVGAGRGPGLREIVFGEALGNEDVTLLQSNLPSHAHVATTSIDITNDASSSSAVLRGLAANANTNDPTGSVLANSPARENIYNTGLPSVDMSADAIVLDINVTSSGSASTTIQPTGQGQTFDIRNPYLGMTWLIAVQGIFPSRN